MCGEAVRSGEGLVVPRTASAVPGAVGFVTAGRMVEQEVRVQGPANNPGERNRSDAPAGRMVERDSAGRIAESDSF